MRALCFDEFGGNETLHEADLPIPEPKKGEVQIEISHAGVNPVDWKMTEGWLKNMLRFEFPVIPGWDAAGKVSKLGEGVSQFQIGDPVFAYCRNPEVIDRGTYAEYICFDAEGVSLKPESLSLKEAAAIPLVGLTAWQSLFGPSPLKKGQSILIHAGAGGVGSLAIQLAKWAGAKVYTTASESNHDYVKSLGADVAIDYKRESIDEVLKQHEADGVDFVYDCVGDPVFDKSLKYVKKGGALVTICVFSFDKGLAEKHGIQIHSVFVQPNGQELNKLKQLFDDGALKAPQVHEVSFSGATDAWDQLRTQHTRGKIVLKIGS